MTVPAPLSGICLWSVVLWGLGWRYREISQPSDTKTLHLCSHRNNPVLLKVTLGWAAAAAPFDGYVPPLGVCWKWRLFSSTLWASHVQREGDCWAGSVPTLIPKWQQECYTFSPCVSSWHGCACPHFSGLSADGKPFISSKQNQQLRECFRAKE